jgi:hypothetical protein
MINQINHDPSTPRADTETKEGLRSIFEWLSMGTPAFRLGLVLGWTYRPDFEEAMLLIVGEWYRTYDKD